MRHRRYLIGAYCSKRLLWPVILLVTMLLTAAVPHTRVRTLAADATATTFTPFLDLVPSEDGQTLFINAGGIGTPQAELFSNISIGPGGKKGSYTMTYSATEQIYLAAVTGFTPAQSLSATISITGTGGLDSGPVELNRAYVPASTSDTVVSMDGRLQLRILNTDTFTSSVYIAVVPSYAPPGPAPDGYRFVGSSYSVRASGAQASSSRPMSLHLGYDAAALGSTDPQTLAIFAWDAFGKRWDKLDGWLFSEQSYVAAAAERFTSYALMAAVTEPPEQFVYVPILVK